MLPYIPTLTKFCTNVDEILQTSKQELVLQTLHHFTYVTAHSPILPLLHLHHSSFSNPSFASPTSQIFTYVTWRAAFGSVSNYYKNNIIILVIGLFPMKYQKSMKFRYSNHYRNFYSYMRFFKFFSPFSPFPNSIPPALYTS